MQVTNELMPMFSYSIIPIVLLILILIVLLIILLIKPNKNKNKMIIVIPPKKELSTIKEKYLTKVNNLLKDVNNQKIANRIAYQKLSNYIRNFIYETTSVKVRNYTLKDIENAKLPKLYELVSEYYDPEFSKFSKGNIVNSIEKTRMVIARWK